VTFNSVQFLVFFPIVLIVYALVFGRPRSRDLWLLLSSYVFYMAWNWQYAALILFSTLVDYELGRRMARSDDERTRKLLVTLSLVLNLGLLGFFKYHNFFVDSSGILLEALGFGPVDFLRHPFLLPVGISFYTFQSLSYTIDLYRRQITVETSFVKFALFVAFFPQLVAGPIVRASEFLPQLRNTPDVTRERVTSGLGLMFRGLIKKILVADMLASLGVDTVFADPGSFSSLTLLLAVYGYSFQIYNDFSGYSDIAIGAARILGFDLPENFRRPYLAQNVREFWTRWHISLSTWLRDYLYIPLGGNRGSHRRTRFNLMATMLLGGLWHGAAWNFVLWGGWHGLLLMLARSGPRVRTGGGFLQIWLRRFLCFHLVAVSWLLFRVGDLGQLGTYLAGLGRLSGGTDLSPLYLVILAATAIVHFSSKSWADGAQERFQRLPVVIQAAAYAALMLVFGSASFGAPAFIYFQF
jgi:D-alanyl-lipoteichoic acid acyltransferase DltB (MBOAT superfamily)